MALKLRRGTEAERLVYTPEEGELVYTTDAKKVWIGDGTTVGGNPVTTTGAGGEFGMLNLIDDTTPQLGGNLDLNNFSINGVGEINIDGSIYATGNINLGNDPADTINVGGQITGSLVPLNSGAYTLGTLSNNWGGIFAEGINVAGEASVNSIVLSGSIKNADSSVVYDASSGVLNATTISANAVTADLTGSVFGDDSTTIIDGLTNSLSTGTITISGGSITSSEDLLFGTEEEPLVNITVRAIENTTIYSRTEGGGKGYISLKTGRGTFDSPAALQPNDELGGIVINGYVDGTENAALAGLVGFFVDSDANINPGDSFIKSSLALLVSTDTSQDAENAFLLNSSGVATSNAFAANKYMQLPVFADDAARLAAIPTPGKGMMVFMEAGTVPAATNQMQVFDGTNWVNAS